MAEDTPDSTTSPFGPGTDETALPEPEAGPDTLTAVRQRGLFLFGALLWAAAGGAVLLAGLGLIAVLRQGVALAQDLRRALGWPPPVGPDLLLLGLYGIAALVLLLVLWLLRRAYRKSWERRLAAVWPEKALRRRYAKPGRLRVRADPAERERRAERLGALLKSPAWSGEGPDETVTQETYPRAAEGLLLRLETEIAERAITTGLVVGLSPSRFFDSLTIVLAAFEIQMHVLSRLGARPSWRMWRELLKRCGASLFANSYLHRGDAMAVSFAVKKAAMGLQAASEMVEEGRDLLSELDPEEAVDLLLGDGVLPDRLRPVISASVFSAGLGLGVGAVGLRIVGQAVEKIGDDLLQGVLAGGVLYFHGIALASDCLALDREHRASPAMNRSFLACARAAGGAAGLILRDQIRARREAFRARRKAAFKQSGKLAGGAFKRFWKSGG